MNFIEELEWRGMLHDATPNIKEHLSKAPAVGYIGFDPTAPSLTIGNYVQIMLLKLFQLSGHKPIFLLGGATGRIGDPSGKDKERELKSFDELDKNLEFQKQQAAKFLDFDAGANSAVFLNNLDFYKEMNVLDFLRDVGKNLTVNYMLSKDSVKKRLDSGLSFTEFSYQLLQANDFLHLYNQHGCTVQMGGSDQWGNITSGTEFIRRNTDHGKAFAVTTPLLTKADGSKFGKSTKGNIWLDASMTSPYRFYQFWINTADDDIDKFGRYFSLKSRTEIIDIENDLKDNPNAKKQLLAEELTKRVHSEDDFISVRNVSQLLFNPKASSELLHSLKANDLLVISSEIPSREVAGSTFKSGMGILDFLTEATEITKSKGEARRAIKNNAIAINKVKIKSEEFIVDPSQFLAGNHIMVENGKKNKFMIRIATV